MTHKTNTKSVLAMTRTEKRFLSMSRNRDSDSILSPKIASTDFADDSTQLFLSQKLPQNGSLFMSNFNYRQFKFHVLPTPFNELRLGERSPLSVVTVIKVVALRESQDEEKSLPFMHVHARQRLAMKELLHEACHNVAGN